MEFILSAITSAALSLLLWGIFDLAWKEVIVYFLLFFAALGVWVRPKEN